MKKSICNFTFCHTYYKECFEMKVTLKNLLKDRFWPFFRHMYLHLSQNRGTDGHFEVLNGFKS